MKNVVGGYSSAQVLVRNATSNDATGPTTYDMEEIASCTYQSQTEFMEVMDMLDRRLNDKGKNWRHIAKSLTVLDYLVRFGSEKCVLWAKDNIYIVKTLREFIHLDDLDKDQGAIIRVKAKELVSLLRDDERLKHERALAKRGRRTGTFDDGDDDDNFGEGRRDRDRRREQRRDRGGDEPYDADLQRALELSRMTAEEEQLRAREAENDPELEAAIKLSLEEEELRRQNQNANLLDLNEGQQQQQQQPQQQYFLTGYYQQPQQQQFFQQPTQQYQQYDMFGNPIQNSMETGLYQNQFDQQQQQQQQQQQPQYQPNQFTGFNYGQPQQQEQLQPLKTGSNNPFALVSDSGNNQSKSQSQTLNALAEQKTQEQYQQQQQQQQQAQFYTQPTASLKQQNTASSRFNETHELNDLLTQGTGLDTFGNTGAARTPHQHTRTQNFINSSGTGYKQVSNDQHRVSSNATGNPFLNTGIGYQQQNAPPPPQQQQINTAYTGYGFGNAQPQPQPQQYQRQANGEGPSLIDI